VRTLAFRILMLAVAAGTVTACRGCGNSASAPQGTGPTAGTAGLSSPVISISNRGPGMHRQPSDALRLPVERSFDLAHVQPQHFAAALGNDPTRIFNWVRDEIAYEAYVGCLRGPRGTLLAMAGNSVDRAALLASLLQHAGQKVQFAQGTLSEADARDLVTSMWADRATTAQPLLTMTVSPALQAAGDTFAASVARDYTLIREQLDRGGIKVNPVSRPTLEELVTEARQHFWVRWSKDGDWIDLDPSFADATAGRVYARMETPHESLPESVFHRVEIRVKLEEYAGDQPAVREILRYDTTAAELSGVDLVLNHQPDGWQGPAADLQSALSSAIQDSGRIKPVLVTPDDRWVTGDAFAPKAKTGGLGSIPFLLGGAADDIATAESVEFTFIAPDRQRETVVREIFDLITKTERESHRRVSAEEIKTRTSAASAPDLTNAVFSLFFTTGRIESGHLPPTTGGDPVPAAQGPDVRTVLRRLSTAFTLVSDRLLWRLGQPEDAIVVFYPSAPRLQIVELSKINNDVRLSMDLRRSDERSLAVGPRQDLIIGARILKGVLEGTLERVLIESAAGEPGRTGGFHSGVSTSTVFERAQANQIPLALLPRDYSQLRETSPDTLQLLRQETAGGHVVVAPQRSIAVSGEQRLAWWRVDPRSGSTVAVTDRGLHGNDYLFVTRVGRYVGVITARMQLQWIGYLTAEEAQIYVQLLTASGVPFLRRPPFSFLRYPS